jgi:hypothetical protein
MSILQMTYAKGVVNVTVVAPGNSGTGADGTVWARAHDGRWYTSEGPDGAGGHTYATSVETIEE